MSCKAVSLGGGHREARGTPAPFLPNRGPSLLASQESHSVVLQEFYMQAVSHYLLICICQNSLFLHSSCLVLRMSRPATGRGRAWTNTLAQHSFQFDRLTFRVKRLLNFLGRSKKELRTRTSFYSL